MRSFVVLLLLALVAVSYQQATFDSAYLPNRDNDNSDDDAEDTSFYDPSCFNECDKEKYQPMCAYLLNRGFRTVENGCDYKNLINCESKKLRLVYPGRCQYDSRGQVQ